MKKIKYTSPDIELFKLQTERLMNPVSVTENGQTSPDMGIGGDSPGGQEADAKKGLFVNDDNLPNYNPWDE